MFTPPSSPNNYGYTCQAWLAVEIGSRVFGTSGYAWFAIQFNPVDNVDSSNACELYRALSRAVQQNDVGSRLIRDYRTQLIDFVNREESKHRVNATDAAVYRREIMTAPLSAFRPLVWRLDLQQIATKGRHGNSPYKVKAELRKRAAQVVASRPSQVLQPDEYLIDDLQSDEYEVIITE